MLVRFAVSNFLSFNEEVVFDMLATPLKGAKHKHHVYKKKVDILKCAAIYGANGAGKSNLIRSLEYLQELILDGEIETPIEQYKFRLSPNKNEHPTTFEIEFIVEKKMYNYGLSILKKNIIEEWLYETSPTAEPKRIFERKFMDQKTQIQISEKYKKTQKDRLLIELFEEKLLAKNELFINQHESLEVPEIDKTRDWLLNKMVIIHPRSKYQTLAHAFTSSDEFRDFTNGLLSTFNTGVAKLKIEEHDFHSFFGESEEGLKAKQRVVDDLEDEEVVNWGSIVFSKDNNNYSVKSLVALHNGDEIKDVPFLLNEESDGTQRLLDLIPAFKGILDGEFTFIVDEIEQSLHPVLLLGVIEKLMKDNSTKGQLIFSTHESNLLNLDIFRTDEIWFVEKNKKLSSEIYSLREFKPRHDLDIRKGFLRGRFGAIPFMADLESLNWNNYGIQE